MSVQPLQMSVGSGDATPAKLPVLKALSCPKCGASLSQFMPTAQTLVCPSCRSHVALGGEELSILGAGRQLPPPPAPINLGQNLKLPDGTYFVLGRVLYEGRDDEDTWRWTEWLLGSADGRLFWLSYDKEAGFVLFRKLRLREPVQQRFIPIGDGQKAPINERYPANIIGAEGELTFRAKAGDKLTMIEGAAHGKKYSVQQTLTEIEAYEGTPISGKAIAEALGDETWAKRLDAQAGRAALFSSIGLFAFIFAAISLVMFVVTNSSGELIGKQVLNLSTAQREARFPINLEANGRPIQIKLWLQSGIPVNTYAEVEVNVTAPNEIETFIFEKEFYYETGRDEDGPWTERDYFGDAAFTVELSGEHAIELTLGEASPSVADVSVEVSLYRNVILSVPFLIYAAVVGAGGLLLVILGAAQKSK